MDGAGGEVGYQKLIILCRRYEYMTPKEKIVYSHNTKNQY